MSLVLNKKSQVLIHNAEKQEYYVVEASKVLVLLGKNVSLEKGFKVKHLVKLLKNYPLLQEINSYIKPFVNDYDTYVKETKQDTKITTINIFRYIEENYDPNDSCRYYHYIRVNGANNKDPNDLPYGLDGSALEEYKNTEINLAPGVHIKLNPLYKPHSSTGKYIKEEFCPEYSLFDVIQSIFFEFSFYGFRKQRKKFVKKISKK